MSGLELYKSEKLCRKSEIEKLYAQGASIIAYPLRAVWVVVPSPDERHRVGARFLISIPKKRIRHAVDRVLLRRRIRESYRLNRHLFCPIVKGRGKTVLVGFNWLATHTSDYATIERSMKEILQNISTTIKDGENNEV